MNLKAFLAALILGPILAAQTSIPKTESGIDPKATGLLKNIGLSVPKGRIWIDQPGDGRTWVRGDDYKGSFSAGSVSLIPFLGSSAPCNYPIDMKLEEVRVGTDRMPLESAKAPVVVGDRLIRIPHGAVTEVYEAAPGYVEQEIVIDRKPGSGDLVVRFAVESELPPSPTSDGGLEFANELGGMRCGRAEAIDAAGRRGAMRLEWRRSGIEMVIPAAFVAEAAFPLTIDPLWTVFWPSSSAAGSQELNPDVAYDVASDRFLVVFEHVFSANDHDILSRQCADSGVFAGVDAWIDFTTTSWGTPRVASNTAAQQFLVVAERGPAGSRTIWGRTRQAQLSVSLGNQFQISGTEAGEKVHPDVGGDPSPTGPSSYCVVWQAGLAPSGRILFNLVTTTSQLQNASSVTIYGTGLAHQSNPAISKSDGQVDPGARHWTVVWERAFTNPASLGAVGIATIPWDGSFGSPFQVGVLDYAPNHFYTKPAVSSLTRDDQGAYWFLAAYQDSTNDVNYPTDTVVLLSQTVDNSGYSLGYGRVSGLASFLGLPPGNATGPSVETDGYRFAVGFSYAQAGSPDLGAPEIMTLHRTGTGDLGVTEAPIAMNYYNGLDDHLRMTSKYSGGGNGATYLTVWDVTSLFSASDQSPLGATYDGYSPLGTDPANYLNQIAPACGGLSLTFSGFPALGYAVSVDLTGSVGAPYLIVGSPISPIALCSGCLLAVDPFTALILQTASAYATVPGNGDLVNTQIAIQGADVGVTGACPGSPAFSLSEAFVITFL